MGIEKDVASLKGKEIYDLIKSRSSKNKYSSLEDLILNEANKLGQDQAFYTIDLGDILWKAQLWKDKFSNVEPFYAVKANSDPAIVRLFVLLGFGFDCSTQGEIKVALTAGADPSKIIYAHTVKSTCGLKYAKSVGVSLLTFDCGEELAKIAKHYPESSLVLRLKPEGNHNNVFNLGKKFGCGVSECESLLKIAKELQLDVVGVSFHAGALCEDPKAYTTLIKNCRTVFDRAANLGYKLSIVDIGAGFHGTHSKEAFFCNLSEEIRSSLQENFPDGNIRTIAEPGAYFVGSSCTLTTTVIGKKRIERDEATGIEVLYYLNEGYYGSFFPHNELYENRPEPLLPPGELEKRGVLASKLWGQTCCSEDVISQKRHLTEMEAGELLVWRNMGAYNRMLCSTFTEVLLPVIRHVFVDNPRLKLNWIDNAEDVVEFLAKTAIPIEEDHPPSIANGNC